MPEMIPVCASIVTAGPIGEDPLYPALYAKPAKGGGGLVGGFGFAPVCVLSPPVNPSQKLYLSRSPSASVALKSKVKGALKHTTTVSFCANTGLELLE